MRLRSKSSLAPTPIERLLSPLASYIQTEASAGLMLMGTALVALIWANSPASEGYRHLWEWVLGIEIGPWSVKHSLHAWINDGLMAVFFFLVGLEIKREVLVGELATVRRAALPAAAALGGMVVPAALYGILNAGSPGSRGWGIPMATDIAFALGVLTLLGPRVPTGLKVFLAALAIVDDIGAVLVIAVFYTASIQWGALATAFLLLALGAIANRAGVRRPIAYLALGIPVWALFLASGVHATVAGVLLAMVIPARTRINGGEFLEHTHAALHRFENAGKSAKPVLSNIGQQNAIHDIEEVAEAAQAPSHRIEHSIHSLVAFAIIPLFALSNAGVGLSPQLLGEFGDPIVAGVIVGLVFGKPLGITLFSWLAVRLRLADLPEGLTWGQLHAVSWLGGIGFTMSLFIGGLAFQDAAMSDLSKIGTFTASILAGLVGAFLVGRSTRRKEVSPPG